MKYLRVIPEGVTELGPPTPCPARVEYATPVFARNYQGVAIRGANPYEGYFTQTIEVTRCMQSRCHYLDGGCLSSPRWVSLLVAELHYPHVLLSPDTAATPAQGSAQGPATPTLDDFQDYQQYLQKRAGSAPAGVAGGSDGSGSAPAGSGERPHCDGHDHLGSRSVVESKLNAGRGAIAKAGTGSGVEIERGTEIRIKSVTVIRFRSRVRIDIGNGAESAALLRLVLGPWFMQVLEARLLRALRPPEDTLLRSLVPSS
ncbi:hypothetical protein EVAR_43155_1 [Eumeta japonica]|uniref:Uncharacterized protein n=1 Tax=Eumeta variegata TaxID=151549 RepID=A0A4C1XLP5_EUMVA|nr:hypothetical protein EVAR_43155_1 [Eumeta japonica]